MIINNFVTFCLILFSFVFLCIILPYVFVRPFYKGRSVVEKAYISLIFGCLFISLIYYYLGFIHFVNIYGFIIHGLIFLGSYLFFFRRRQTVDFYRDMVLRFKKISKGDFSSFFYKDKLKAEWEKLVARTVVFLKKHPLSFIICSFSVGYAFYCRSFHSLTEVNLGMPDQYTHTYWTQYFESGTMFKGGMYPFAMHSTVLAIRQFFGFDLYAVMHFLGPVAGIITAFSLYLFMKKLVRNRAALCIALLFYFVSSFIYTDVTQRQAYLLPQEFAMMFLYPAAYFLHNYLTRKRSSDLVVSAASFCITIQSHFYIALASVILLSALLIPFIVKIFKRRMVKPLFFTFFISGFIGILPFVAGMIFGYPWEPSMAWASNVISGSDSVMFFTKSFYDFKNYITFFLRVYMDVRFVPVVLIMLGISIIASLVFIRKNYYKTVLGVCIYFIVLCFIQSAPFLNLPVLIDSHRTITFIGFCMPIILVLPFSMLINALKKFKGLRPFVTAASFFAVFVFGYYLFSKGMAVPGYSLTGQYSGAVTAYYNIEKTHENGTYTFVSPTQELPLVMGSGSHYELCNFIVEMENYDENTIIKIPTKYVFFYVEKRPLKLFEYKWYDGRENKNSLPLISREDAKKPLPVLWDNTVLYNSTYRGILQAKAFYWALDFKKRFPDEMQIYYEDDRLLIYRFEKTNSFNNNFAINYGYN